MDRTNAVPAYRLGKFLLFNMIDKTETTCITPVRHVKAMLRVGHARPFRAMIASKNHNAAPTTRRKIDPRTVNRWPCGFVILTM
jgi:hypothetical protein